MDAALVINGVVDTVYRNAVATEMPEHPTGQWVEAPANEVFGGFLYSNGEFTAPAIEPPPASVPAEISASQFFRALWKAGEISFEECRAALKTGDLPAAMAAMVDQLPEGERQDALLIIEGATSFRRAHPLVAVFAQLYGMTSEETDDLWRVAAGL